MQTLLYGVWAALYLLCTALGLLTEGTGVFCVILSVLFFLPPAILLMKGDGKDRKIIGCLSAASLFLTALAIIAGGLTEHPNSRVLEFFTVAVSSPMALCQTWTQGLFLWACLLFGSIFGKRE